MKRDWFIRLAGGARTVKRDLEANALVRAGDTQVRRSAGEQGIKWFSRASVSLKPAPLLLHSVAHSRTKQWEDRQLSCSTCSRW